MRPEYREALEAAAAGEFKPWFYRVKVSPRKWKRYRMPGMASRVTPKEALAMQAFLVLEGCSTSEIARRFHRKRETVRRALASAAISAGNNRDTSSTDDRDASDVRTSPKEFYPMNG